MSLRERVKCGQLSGQVILLALSFSFDFDRFYVRLLGLMSCISDALACNVAVSFKDITVITSSLLRNDSNHNVKVGFICITCGAFTLLIYHIFL